MIIYSLWRVDWRKLTSMISISNWSPLDCVTSLANWFNDHPMIDLWTIGGLFIYLLFQKWLFIGYEESIGCSIGGSWRNWLGLAGEISCENGWEEAWLAHVKRWAMYRCSAALSFWLIYQVKMSIDWHQIWRKCKATGHIFDIAFWLPIDYHFESVLTKPADDYWWRSVGHQNIYW